ncbi:MULTISPECIES: exodeoxyribonuclease VII large subunit [unclassified Meridianimarinicoccus]|uniref:exodeoxyribonuclease VII large subunit n=1 Tax=unclassified Meridianimarinicoccus TaxID=2923344 RepID=UPI001867FE3A|nr:exodeoxyribonuclease VII large subunit [Fluviibacterium sp. MJW13]
MSDLFEDPSPVPGDNAPEFTVSEISGAVKKTIEGGFARVRVRGELGRVSRPRSGHVYLDLKDDRSVLAGVIWKGQAAKLATQPEEGLEVIATGRLTTFPGQSKYQMVIDSITPAGAGALMAMLEKRKKMLEAEGLFAPERKRPLPYLPQIIGVVTSPSGAVIRDILHRLRDRFPSKVLIWPVAVQGERCAPEVARAIEGFNRMTPGGALPRPDVLIVARGGGSIEDLWGFNEEVVARAAAASEIPLISAVGHETDTTLIDFVSDRRAPTPTAAAEIAVPVRAELLAFTEGMGARLAGAHARSAAQRGQRLRDLSRALPRPQDLTRHAEQRFDAVSQRLPVALRSRVHQERARLNSAKGSLHPGRLNDRLEAQRQRLAVAGKRLDRAAETFQSRRKLDLAGISGRLSLRSIRQKQAAAPGDLSRLQGRLRQAWKARMGERRQGLAALERLRGSLGYESTLARGFAVVRAGDTLVTSAASGATQSALQIQFRDGVLEAVPATDGGAGPEAKPAPSGKRRKIKDMPPDQGSLF